MLYFIFFVIVGFFLINYFVNTKFLSMCKDAEEEAERCVKERTARHEKNHRNKQPL